MTIGVEITVVGELSFTLACDTARDDETTITTETVLVAVDKRESARNPSDDWRDAMDPNGH